MPLKIFQFKGSTPLWTCACTFQGDVFIFQVVYMLHFLMDRSASLTVKQKQVASSVYFFLKNLVMLEGNHRYVIARNQGPVVQSMVSANHWLSSIKINRLSWYLTLVSANQASRYSAQNNTFEPRGVAR